MELKKFKKKLLKKSPEFREEYYSYDLGFEIGQILIEARSARGITQKKLAEMVNTHQSGIARAEGGKYLPSLTFLNKIAGALKTRLIVTFELLSANTSYNKTNNILDNVVFTTPEHVEKQYFSYKQTATNENSYIAYLN